MKIILIMFMFLLYLILLGDLTLIISKHEIKYQGIFWYYLYKFSKLSNPNGDFIFKIIKL